MVKLRNIINNNNIQNGAWLYLLQIFNTIIPLITLPYITRILGPSEYGRFAIALNIIGYMQVVIEYGFGMSATRKVVLILKNSNNEYMKSLKHLFSCVVLSRLFLLTFSLFTCIAYSIFFINDNLEIICMIVLSIGLFGYVLQQNWLFQGLQKMKYISLANIIARIISIIFIFSFVKSQQDLILYCLIYSLTTVIDGLIGIFISVFRYGMCLVKISIKDIIIELKDGWYVFTTSLSSKVFSAIGITFLGLFSDVSEVGMFSAIQKIPMIIIMGWTPIAQVFFPISSKQLSSSYKDGRKYILRLRKLVIPFFAILCTIIAFFSNIIIKLAFGVQYAEKSYWIIPLLLWVIIGIDSNFWGIQLLVGSGHDKEYSTVFMIGLIATIVLNFFLIIWFHSDGACIAPVLSELVLNIALRVKEKHLRNNMGY